MALSDLAFLSHGAASVSANYAMAWARELLFDAEAQTFFVAQDSATLGRPGGQQYGQAAVVNFTRDIKRIRGDSVQINQVGNLKGRPTSGVLRGNEENIAYNYMTIATTRKRKAIGYERYAQEKSFWDWRATGRKLLAQWLARQQDKQVFDAMISGTSVIYANSVDSPASASVMGMASGGLVVSDLSKAGKIFTARNAKPLGFGGRDGVQIPGYAVVMPPDQYADVMDETSMKSAFQLAWEPGANHPLRHGAMTRYKNLWIFQLGGDLWTGGSPLQPRCKLYTDCSTSTGVGTIFVSTSGSAAAPTQYFPSSGYLLMYDPGGSKYERIHYTAKDDYSFTLTSKRAAATRTSHTAATTIVAYEIARVVAFGAEVVAKVSLVDPMWIYEDQDYRERLGMGLRWIDGFKKIDDTLDKTPGILVFGACHDRTIEII